MNVSIFATTNDIDSLSNPLRSRFLEFSLPEYTFEEFDKLAVKLLGERYGHTPELAHKVSDVVWNKILSRDCRDILQVGKLSKSISDVEFVATTLRKYKRKHANRQKAKCKRQNYAFCKDSLSCLGEHRKITQSPYERFHPI
jgi:hypothetical protein